MGHQASSQRHVPAPKNPPPPQLAASPTTPVSPTPEKKILTLAKITEFWTLAHAEGEKRPPVQCFCDLLTSYLAMSPLGEEQHEPILSTSELDHGDFTLDKAIALVYRFTNTDLTPISLDLDNQFASAISLSLSSAEFDQDLTQWLRHVPADSYFSLLHRDITTMVSEYSRAVPIMRADEPLEVAWTTDRSPHIDSIRICGDHVYFIKLQVVGVETQRRIYAVNMASGAVVWRSETLAASKRLRDATEEIHLQVWAPGTLVTWYRGIAEVFAPPCKHPQPHLPEHIARSFQHCVALPASLLVVHTSPEGTGVIVSELKRTTSGALEISEELMSVPNAVCDYAGLVNCVDGCVVHLLLRESSATSLLLVLEHPTFARKTLISLPRTIDTTPPIMIGCLYFSMRTNAVSVYRLPDTSSRSFHHSLAAESEQARVPFPDVLDHMHVIGDEVVAARIDVHLHKCFVIAISQTHGEVLWRRAIQLPAEMRFERLLGGAGFVLAVSRPGGSSCDLLWLDLTKGAVVRRQPAAPIGDYKDIHLLRSRLIVLQAATTNVRQRSYVLSCLRVSTRSKVSS